MKVNNGIYLRPLADSDVTPRYLEWLRDEQVHSFLEVRGDDLVLDDIKEYISKGPRTGEYYMYAICDAASNLHIGNVKVGPIITAHRVSDLPVVIGDKSYWGKGVATEAIKLGGQTAFDEHGIRKLQGQIYRGNIGSLKAYCRAGWVIEGVIQGRYLVNGEPMDQVIVSCNNPKELLADPSAYSLEELRRLQSEMRSWL
jgi:RimJ/RimL family protein N-acetyltransferase